MYPVNSDMVRAAREEMKPFIAPNDETLRKAIGAAMEVPVGKVPSVSEMRFDVCYDKHGCKIAPHFCREWDEDGGCYGTNPDHGYSFEEACDQVAEYHERQVKEWRARTHYTCLYYLDNGDTDD